jgi:hypothetical protein
MKQDGNMFSNNPNSSISCLDFTLFLFDSEEPFTFFTLLISTSDEDFDFEIILFLFSNGSLTMLESVLTFLLTLKQLYNKILI